MKRKQSIGVVLLRLGKMVGWLIAAAVVFIISLPFMLVGELETFDF